MKKVSKKAIYMRKTKTRMDKIQSLKMKQKLFRSLWRNSRNKKMRTKKADNLAKEVWLTDKTSKAVHAT